MDYCYDHAAEADCDYACGTAVAGSRPRGRGTRGPCFACPPSSPARYPRVDAHPAQFDVPALSPASQLSHVTAHEAIIPHRIGAAEGLKLLPCRGPSMNLLYVRKPSNASSFKEAHGFNLSPSSLIPQDFQQQMLAGRPRP